MLEVDEEGVRFETLYESSNKTAVKANFLDVSTFAAAGGHTAYRYSNDDSATVELPARAETRLANEVSGGCEPAFGVLRPDTALFEDRANSFESDCVGSFSTSTRESLLLCFDRVGGFPEIPAEFIVNLREAPTCTHLVL